jgi:cellulose synthase/poly-beta-1,6-N-acetylglucosamine synthase-like glycosyltransferase
VIDAALWPVAHTLAWYAVASAISGLALTASATWLVFRHRREHELSRDHGLPDGRTMPPVSVVLVTSEDDASIGERLDALAALDYPAFEVVVISNGPISPNLARAITRLQTRPVDLIYRPLVKAGRVTACYHSATPVNLTVLEKERGSVADALNAGLNAARSPYLCLVEPGVWLDRAALARLMAPVMDDPERVVLTAGIERVMNGCEVHEDDVVVGACPGRPAVAWQVLDGLRRAMLAIGAGPLLGAGVAPRSCVLVQKRELLRVEGVPPDGGVGDLAALPWTRSGLRSAIVSLPVAWTPVPRTLADAAERHRADTTAALDAIRGLWRPWGRITHTGPVWRLIQFARGGRTVTPVLDVAALAVATAGFGRGLVDFSLLLAVWFSVLVGRTAMSSAAILLHDLTPKRYPSPADVLRLFLTASLDPFLGRPLAAWWTLTAVWRRVPTPDAPAPEPAAAHAGQQG